MRVAKDDILKDYEMVGAVRIATRCGGGSH